jgi:hypothetical protein
MGRPRIYDFASLGGGDRMFVALNGRTRDAAASSLSNAAAHYAATRDASFRFSIDTVSTPGFVVLERLGSGGKAGRLVEADRSRLRSWQTIGLVRPLTDHEVRNVKRAYRRIEARLAA